MANRCDVKIVAIIAVVCLYLSISLVSLMYSHWGYWALFLGVPCVIPAYLVYKEIERNKQETALRASRSDKLVGVYHDTIEALASAIAAKDFYAQGHVSRIQKICAMVGDRLGLGADEVYGIQVAALVHDIGKLGVPEYIVLKPGPLDPDEFSKVKNHADIGAKILECVEYPWDVQAMVRHHHEKYDGTGYPDHLSGDDIPIGSRIISVAEVYDALISDRCYRDGWPHQEAVEHIKHLSGTHFDPGVVQAFLDVESVIAQMHDEAPKVGKGNGSERTSDWCAAADMICQANKELISLFDIAQTLSSTLEIDEVLALLAQRTRRLLQADTCAVFMADDSRPHHLIARVAVGRYSAVFRNAAARMGKGITGKAALLGQPEMANYDPDELTFPIHANLALDLKSCIVAPIISYGKVLGTINLYDVSVHAFTPDDLRTLSFVASRAALAIQNASAFEKVRDSAMRDPLTGLHNVRYLRKYLEHELSRASRRGEPLSVLGIDLDNFKSINDSFGHQVGDSVLKDAAEILSSQLRDYDLVVRNGGDEFLVVLPGTPAHEAMQTAERIREKFRAYAQMTMNRACAPFGVSVGVASYPDEAADLDALLSAADAAMYRDKRARKNDCFAA